MRQAIFVEKTPTIVEGECEIVPPPMRQRRSLAEYVDQVMIENGEKPKDVEARSKRAGYPISDAQIGNILLEKVKNPGILTLLALAKGLGRPVEEVIAAALAELPTESAAFKESEFASLWDIYRQLPNGEQRIFKRYLQMLRREMLSS
jgi:hypothetical protein